MAFKFVALASLFAVASAGVVSPLGYSSYGAAPLEYAAQAAPLAYASHAAPLAYAASPVIAKTVEFDAHPQYNYAYSVQDAITGDNKQQEESRDGDVVRGSYSLVESDGTRRVVQYTADDVNGFNAIVHKEPLVQKAIVAAPAVARIASPIAYAAPVARYAAPLSYGAPVARYGSPLSYGSSLGYAAPAARYGSALSYASPIAQGYAAPAYNSYASPLAARAYLG